MEPGIQRRCVKALLVAGKAANGHRESEDMDFGGRQIPDEKIGLTAISLTVL